MKTQKLKLVERKRPLRKAIGLPSPEATADSGLFDQQFFSHEIFFVEHGDGSPGFPLRRHLHERKPPRLACLEIFYDLYRHDVSGIRKEGFDVGFGGLGWEIRYVDFL